MAECLPPTRGELDEAVAEALVAQFEDVLVGILSHTEHKPLVVAHGQHCTMRGE